MYTQKHNEEFQRLQQHVIKALFQYLILIQFPN